MASTESGSDRSVVLASADRGLRQRLRDSLTDMRWQVREARGGAEAIACLEEQCPEALLTDHWLPDLEVGEFVTQMAMTYPEMELLRFDGDLVHGTGRSPRRHELLHALREAVGSASTKEPACARTTAFEVVSGQPGSFEIQLQPRPITPQSGAEPIRVACPQVIPEMVGNSAPMRELARLIHLVAPRKATVLIEGETGSGKEIVARALHRLSTRASKPLVVLNCAAIPEALLEAELFGHTRGAFTGAVQSRTGRIEAAHGGTLFLDEIGEMPLPLQAKMLRFLEFGELQRVGDNETARVDVRVIAATHQPLERRSAEGTFRLDLYHRLAVFPLELPPLRERREDIALLTEHLLAELGRDAPRKTISSEGMEMLEAHEWPGNVRELGHVLERACILAEERSVIGREEIRIRRNRAAL